VPAINQAPPTLASIIDGASYSIEILYGQDSGEMVKEHVDYSRASAQMSFKVPWQNRWQFVLSVMGQVSITGGVNGTVTRYAPMVYPDFPALYCQGIDMQGWGNFEASTNTSIIYDWAVVTCVFGTFPWNFQGLNDPNGLTNGLYRSQSVEFSGEMLSLPAAGYKFSASPQLPVTQNIGRIVPLLNISITQHMCPSIPFATLFSLIGNVNSTSFYGAATGTVLFLGASSESDFSLTQNNQSWLISQKLTTKFTYRAIPWNMFLRPDGTDPNGNGGYDTVVNTAGGNVYPAADLNQIFYDSGSPS
jgi:hypothetical protein